MPDTQVIIAVVAGILALIILIAGVISMRADRKDSIEERLGRYTDFETYDDIPSAGTDLEEPSQLTKVLDRALVDREIGK